jgi:hypothetical protein
MRDIGRGYLPKVHQSVKPTGYRSGRIGGFSKGAPGHPVVFLASGLADRGSSTVRPSVACTAHSYIDAVQALWRDGPVRGSGGITSG